MLNKIICLLFIISLNISAANLYVDTPPAESGSDWDGVDGHAYTGSPGVGVGYATVNAALTAQTSGDDIYIRGGTYQETGTADDAFHMDYTNNGTSGDWSSIQSYPGEWAILDANDARYVGLGDKTNQVTCPDDNGACIQYISIERLEIKNATNWGICLAGGPLKIRYSYIHDNVSSTYTDNPAGIYGVRPTDWIVEYNLIEDNGSTTANTNNANIQTYSDQAASTDPQACTDEYFLATGLCQTSGRLRNEIRYNKIIDNDGVATWGIKHKAGQIIMPHATDGAMNATWEGYGDKIHHNIVMDDSILIEQDVAQVYNNFVQDGYISIGYKGDFAPVFSVIYNNYAHYYIFSIPSPTTGTYYFWSPSTSTMFRKDWAYNNIADGQGLSYPEINEEITMGYYLANEPDSGGYDSETVLNLDDFYFKNNYIYRPDNSYDIYNADLPTEGHGTQSLANWEAAYTNIKNNYRKTTSESTDSIFVGTTESDAYKIKTSHVMSGETTIANGGINTAHPYLDTTIPDYVGPINPTDNDWWEGVWGIDVTYLTSQTNGSDPTWIENYVDEIAPTAISASILADGTHVRLIASENVQFGAGGTGGGALTGCSGGATTLGTPSITGTYVEWPITSRTVYKGETSCVLAYTQPTDGLQDTAATPNDMATFADLAVTTTNAPALSSGTPTASAINTNGSFSAVNTNGSTSVSN